MNANFATVTALLLPFALLSLAGCAGTPADTTAIRIVFGTSHADIQASVPFDLAARPADSYFKDAEAAHTSYTALDQIVQWSAISGIPLAIDPFSFGHCLSKIDGIPAAPGCQPGATAYWSIALNGQETLTGMQDTPLQVGDSVMWTLTPIAPQPGGGSAATSAAVSFSAPANLTVHQEMANINGTAPAGTLSVRTDADASTTGLVRGDGGKWSLNVKVAPGRTNVTVLLDDGTETLSQEIVVTRLVEGTVQVDFRGMPGHANRDDKIWVDVDARASGSYYAGQPVAHPPYANVHDLLVTWTLATGVPVVYKPHASFGSQLMQIDGVGDPTLNTSSFWCYRYNDASAGLGITAQEFKAGDVVSWSLGTVC